MLGCSGPGYRSPLDAFKNAPREKLLYVVTVQPNLDEPHGDYLSTIDVDPASPTYCQVYVVLLIYRFYGMRTNSISTTNQLISESSTIRII